MLLFTTILKTPLSFFPMEIGQLGSMEFFLLKVGPILDQIVLGNQLVLLLCICRQ